MGLLEFALASIIALFIAGPVEETFEYCEDKRVVAAELSQSGAKRFPNEPSDCAEAFPVGTEEF